MAEVTNAYRQVHLLYPQIGVEPTPEDIRHKCLSASTFTVPPRRKKPL